MSEKVKTNIMLEEIEHVSEGIELILPGSDVEDKLLIISQKKSCKIDDNICVLTMENVNLCDDVSYLSDIVKNIKNMSITNYLHEISSEIKNIGSIKIIKCGHHFSGVPILYEFMTKKFKCPICRFGSEKEIDLKENRPSTIAPNMWTLLCKIAEITRENDKKQRLEEEEAMVEQISLTTVIAMYEILPWDVSFSIYRNENPLIHERPYAIMSVGMRYDNLLSINPETSSSMENVVLHSGN